VLGERDHNAVSAKQYWYLKKMDLLERKMWDNYHSEVEKLREGAEGDVAFP
jgi:polyphosphate kinase 2 (PPK2 family)